MYSNKWPMGTRVPAKTGTPLIFSGSTSTTSLIFIVLFLAAILALEFTKVPSTLCVGFMPCGVWALSTHYSEWIVLCLRISGASHRQGYRDFQSMTLHDRSNRAGVDSRCPLPYDPLRSFRAPFSACAG